MSGTASTSIVGVHCSTVPSGAVAFTDSGKRYFQLRFETFNLFNHPSFAFPQLAPTNSAFGLITAQSNKSRSVQLTGRIVF